MARDEVYSRVVAGLKIVLPLAALALLSTLFLLSQDREDGVERAFADVLDTGEAAREQVNAPHFAGTTERGDLITMTARSARPGSEGRIQAEAFEADLVLKDGSRIRLDAAHATLAGDDARAELSGGVRIESSTGYSLTTDRMRAATDRISGETLDTVRGKGPAGTLEAGKLRIAPDGPEGDSQLLFTGGVKLIYEPEQE
jgi:lipopolysaccharide export system protein LptC